MGIIRKSKEIYNKHAKLVRFLIILSIALCLNFTIFKSPKIPSDYLEKIEESENLTYLNLENQGYFDLSEEEIDTGNLNSVLWKLISKRAGRDRICFEEKGSYVQYPNRKDYEGFTSLVSYNQGQFFEVEKKKCFDIPKTEQKITFNWIFNVSFDLNISELEERRIYLNETTYMKEFGTISFHPNTETYLKPNLKSEVLKFILVFFSTGALLWAFSRTIQIILYGWFKQ